MNGTNLSRSGRSNPDGKMDERMDVPMTTKMREDIAFAARCAKKTNAEYIRESISLRLYGELAVIEERVAFRGNSQCDE